MPIFDQDCLQIGFFGHGPDNFMSGHAIQALFAVHLAAFSLYVNSIENIDFWVLLPVTQNEFDSPFYYHFLLQQTLGLRLPKHAQFSQISMMV